MIRPSFTLKAAPLETERGTDWRDSAACIGADPELFFPVGDPSVRTASKQEQIREAKAVCATCEVRQPCLDEALRLDSQGVFGGTTDEERAAMRKRKPGGQRQPIDHGDPHGARAHQRRGEKPCGPCREAARAAQARRVN